jgi:class 3 adenylate cyclase/tetratricopeptide (TPR) repeat protein
VISCQACGHDSASDSRFCSQCGARLAAADAQAIPAEVRGQVMTDLRGEERLVTVVFADMTESVRRTSGLSAEEATVLVNPLLETMVELMVRYGGRIDRFLGDGVLAVFGVPAAHEDDPFRAVRAALELRERAVDLGLAVTAGVNTGRVYFGPVGSDLHEELTVMGPTVNLAARFQGAATAGEIVVGSSTAAHLAAAFDLSPVTLTIKGIAEPVPAFKANRLLDLPDKVRGIEGLRAEMVGRDADFDRLRAAFGTGASAALVGPAGVGKSRLAAEFRAFVEGSGGRWLEGRCLQLTEATPYAPFVDLLARQGVADLAGLEASLRSLTESGALGRAEEIAPFLAHLLGLAWGDERDLAVVEASADLRTTLTVDALVEYLAAWGRLGPAALLLEDVHWADPLSRRVIAALHRAEDRPLLVVAYRPDPWITDLLAPPVKLLALEELSVADGRRMISMLLETSGIPDWLESRILDRGQGNPFYVEELIRSLIQRGALTRVTGGWQVTVADVDLELPESVEGVLMSRFDRLADTTRRAAKAASVLDRPFGEPLFTALTGPDLAAELGPLVGAGILRRENPSGDYAFVHALTRLAIYTNLLPSQRADLHEHTAGVLEREPAPDVDRIAVHYEQSRNHAKAVEYLLLAGERALRSFTTDAALSLLERGLARVDELPDPDRPHWRARFHARLGELLERMARHEPARTALHAALDEMDPDPLEAARIWRLVGQTHRLEGDDDSAHRAYDRAEELLAGVADVVTGRREWIRLQKERAMALYFGGRGDELPDHNARVAPVVERYGTAAQLADHLYGQMLSSFVSDHYIVPEETVAMARRAVELAESGADPGRVAEGRFVLGFSLLWGDQLEEAASVLQRAVEETRRVDAVTEACRALAYRAIALRRLGLIDEAEAAAGEGLAAASDLGSSYYRGHALAVLCWVAWRRNGPACDELGEQAFAAWTMHEHDGVTGLGTEFSWLAVWPRAACAVRRGDHAAAVEHLRLLLVPWERPMPDEVRGAVEAAVASGDPADLSEAVRLAELHGLL